MLFIVLYTGENPICVLPNRLLPLLTSSAPYLPGLRSRGEDLSRFFPRSLLKAVPFFWKVFNSERREPKTAKLGRVGAAMASVMCKAR